MARRVETKAKREPMPTIIGAGITEQWYFTHLKSIFDYRIKVRPQVRYCPAKKPGFHSKGVQESGLQYKYVK